MLLHDFLGILSTRSLLRFTITNGVTESLVFSERSANKLYMYIFGFEVMQYSSGTSWTLSVLVVLISTSTTAQLLGGSFVLFFNDTAALLCSSFVSATVFPSMVSTKKLCLVQCTPAACCFAKSTPSMRLLVKFSHTRKVCLNLFFPISISQLILPIAPRLVPFAPTTVGKSSCVQVFAV